MSSASQSESMKLPVDYRKLEPSERRAVRVEYIKRQDGKCYHCKSDLRFEPPESVTKKPINKSLFPERFFDWPVHLHHNHKTGMTIGAVHNYCNAVLWQYHGE